MEIRFNISLSVMQLLYILYMHTQPNPTQPIYVYHTSIFYVLYSIYLFMYSVFLRKTVLCQLVSYTLTYLFTYLPSLYTFESSLPFILSLFLLYSFIFYIYYSGVLVLLLIVLLVVLTRTILIHTVRHSGILFTLYNIILGICCGRGSKKAPSHTV